MKQILKTMTAAAGVCALLGTAAAAQQPDPGQQPGMPGGAQQEPQAQTGTTGAEELSSEGRTFVETAAAENEAEVKLGKLAKDKASHDDVKKFAERMVEDHQKANDRLKDVDIVPQEIFASTEQLKPEKQQIHDRLSQLSGDEFDREYMTHMVEDHEKAVKLFRKQADKTSDRELSQYAERTLPTLENHLEEAKRIHKGLRDTGTRGTTGTTGTTEPEPSGIDQESPEPIGPDDMDDPGHSEPPPPAPTPDPTERP